MARHRLRHRYGRAKAPYPRELPELEAILEEHGYDPKDAKKLNKEGMGPYELEHRIKSTRAGGMGSLEYTHGIHKRGAR